MSEMPRNYSIVSIEGNIGSGKSTLLNNLRAYYENNTEVIFLKEPVDEWNNIQDQNGVSILEKFYADQHKYSFPFQMMAYISRLKILNDALENIKGSNKRHIIITERCLYTDKNVFAKMLYDQGKIEDVCYQIYLKWFDEFCKNLHIDHFVYVRTFADECYERIHKRSRKGEEVIPLSYLEDCHSYHDEYVMNFESSTNVIELDGNVDIYENPDTIEKWIKYIDSIVA